jgi:SET domain-containing protein
MLLVKTELRENENGIGVYTLQHIPYGTAVSKFMEGVDMVLDPDKLMELPLVCKEWIADRAYKNAINGRYELGADNSTFLNHSWKNNITTSLLYNRETKETTYRTWANRDIEIGEELTVNYNDFEIVDDKNNILHQMCEELKIDMSYRKK